MLGNSLKNITMFIVHHGQINLPLIPIGVALYREPIVVRFHTKASFPARIFEFVCLDWSWRVDRAVMFDDRSENALDRYGLIHMAEELESMQRQVSDLFTAVLDADSED